MIIKPNLRVGDWFSHHVSPDEFTYGVVIAIQKNGWAKACYINHLGKAITGSMSHWVPDPKVLRAQDLPQSMVVKIINRLAEMDINICQWGSCHNIATTQAQFGIATLWACETCAKESESNGLNQFANPCQWGTCHRSAAETVEYPEGWDDLECCALCAPIARAEVYHLLEDDRR